MGGLVVKKAYLLGQNDENYKDVVRSISAILFLATPHRGTNLAELLNRMLFVIFQSTKDFIVDLNKSSAALEEINEQFRHVAPKLSIFSFYETLPTHVGPKKLMVLEKESSILGYPGEISKSLNADHHDVCKYTSPEDSNYISVRNALKTLVDSLGPRGTEALKIQSSHESELFEQLFACRQAPEDDFAFFQQRWMPGTCEWILSEPTFKLWLEDTSNSRVAWLNSPPASGKSILSAYIINHMRELGRYCQYFFFKFGDCTKRSPAALLKSIGLQMGRDIPAFGREMAKLSREGVTLEKKDARFIWQKIFISVLSQLVLPKPLYWVIDALDESESPKVLLELLQSLSTFRTPIRVFIVSRKIESLSLAFERLSIPMSVDIIQKDSQENITSDIRMYVEHELKYMRGAEALRLQVMESVLERADGNFLWVHLVLEEILGCHTQQAIKQTLDEIPAGMGALYQRMELAVANNLKEADRTLARTLLVWIVCAYRPLTLKELSQALTPDFPEFLDLKRTIQDVCGQFVVVDHSSHVVMVHKTARDYLTKKTSLQLFIDEKASHGELFAKTISILLRPELRSKLGRTQQPIRAAEPFFIYAATSFPYHLRQAATTSEKMMDMLAMFLKRPSILTWIHLLALFGQLEVLVSAARALTWFGSLNRKLNIEKNPLLHRLQDLELFELWATDLVKIAAKFSRHLRYDPTAIYKIIPPLCPRNSIIARQFGKSDLPALSISGISNAIWNDCLARVSLPNGDKAWKINCAGRHIAVLSSTGSIVLWDSVNFEETCTMRHAEFVSEMCFNSKCDRLVSYGFKTTKIWAIPSGHVVADIPNPTDSRTLAITFAESDTSVLIGSGDKVLRRFHVSAAEEGWHIPDPTLLQENSPVEGGFITSPSFMAFNADATQIAVAYRGYPLSVWATKEPRLIGRCRRVLQHRPDHARPSVSWMAVDRIAWNPVIDHLVGLYKDGCVFKWNPTDDENQETRIIADEIQVSPDGKLFATSDSNGTVKIWNFAYFSLIYQLSSENLVIGLAFSPDCKRLYDLRGSSINAWEPNSLIRFSDNGETLSDTTSDHQTSTSNSQVSEAWIVTIEPVTALASAPGGLLYCVSHDNGTVELFDTTNGKLLDLEKSSAFLAIDHLVWGGDERHIAAVDLGGNISVYRLNSLPPSAGKTQFKVQSLLSGKAKIAVGGVHQILLNRDSTKLLIVSQDFGQIWSVETGNILVSASLEKGETRRWINHPLKPDLLVGAGVKDIILVSWDDLTGVASLYLREDCFHVGGRSSFNSEDGSKLSIGQLSLDPGGGFKQDIYVNEAILTQDGEHLVIQISKRSTKRLLIFETSILECSGNTNSPPILLEFLDVSSEVTTIIEVLLGILPGKRLVFLDKDFWVCTLELNSVKHPDAITRHYFLPRDWISTESLEQCCMLQDGTFLFPKDGEVAVIASGLGEARW